MRHRIAVIALLLAVPVARAGSAEDSDPASDPVARLTGAHTRLVWVQDISKNSGDTFAKGKHLRLVTSNKRGFLSRRVDRGRRSEHAGRCGRAGTGHHQRAPARKA